MVLSLKILRITILAFLGVEVSFFAEAQVRNLMQHPIVLQADSLGKLGQVEAFFSISEARLNVAAHTIPHRDLAAIRLAQANYYRSKGNDLQAALMFEAALSSIQKMPVPDTNDLILLHTKLGLSFSGLDKKQLASEHLQTALRFNIQKFGEISYPVARCYMDFGVVLMTAGEYAKSEAYGLKAIRIFRQINSTQHPDYGGAYHNLGLNAYTACDFRKARTYFSEGLSILQQQLGEHPKTAVCLSTIGSVYADEGQADSALVYQLRALQMFCETAGEQHPYVRVFLTATASAYRAIQQPEFSLGYLQRARFFRDEKGNLGNLTTEIAMGMAATYRALKNYDMAIAYADSALWQLSSIVRQDATFRDYQWHTLLLKASAIVGKYEKTSASQLLLSADSVLQEAHQVIFSLIETLDAEHLQLNFYKNAMRGFELNMDIVIRLYQITTNDKWLRVAFEISENSKSLLLLQELLGNKNRYQNIQKCDPQLVAFEAIEMEIIKLTNQSFENTIYDDTIKDAIFRLESRRDSIRILLTQRYPKYFAPTHVFPKTTLLQLQKQINPNQVLLEYFVTDTVVYIFLVKRDSLFFEKVKLDFSLEKYVTHLRESIGRYHLAPVKTSEIYLSAASDYAHTAYFLYKMLVAPVAVHLESHLIIVPHGILNYIPFDALLTEPVSRPDRFHLLPYFLKKQIIYYAYSMALQGEILRQDKMPSYRLNKLIAFAPFFEENPIRLPSTVQTALRQQISLPVLPSSGAEIKEICRLTDGVPLLSKSATKVDFLEKAPQSRVLHLATHGHADDQNSNLSFVAFSADTTESSMLYVNEVALMQLQAELVTLSACETGTGYLHHGEGVLSIARAFVMAGARSVVQSLWTVSDAATTQLMIYFYENLKNQMPKDEALHYARLKYLQYNRGEATHPFFWASFTILGDMAPLAGF